MARIDISRSGTEHPFIDSLGSFKFSRSNATDHQLIDRTTERATDRAGLLVAAQTGGHALPRRSSTALHPYQLHLNIEMIVRWTPLLVQQTHEGGEGDVELKNTGLYEEEFSCSFSMAPKEDWSEWQLRGCNATHAVMSGTHLNNVRKLSRWYFRTSSSS